MHVPQAIVVCGPSGSGKGTLLRKLHAENKHKFASTVSHTTRKPRQGDVDGRDYHFVERQQMLDMINADEFIEYTEFSGNLYGTSKRAFKDALATNKTVILEVEIEGVKALKKLYAESSLSVAAAAAPQANGNSRSTSNGSGDRSDSSINSFQLKFIFVKPPSKQLLIERLSKRKTESADDLSKRLARADEEMKIAESGQLEFDLTLVNDDLEVAYRQLKEFLRDFI